MSLLLSPLFFTNISIQKIDVCCLKSNTKLVGADVQEVLLNFFFFQSYIEATDVDNVTINRYRYSMTENFNKSTRVCTHPTRT